MPNSNNLTGKGTRYALASSTDIPVPFHQAMSDVPSGLATSVLPPAVKLTSGSTRKSIKRNAIIANHWLNTPLVDGLRSVAAIYKQVSMLAFNYQRTHQDAFFEAYPELLIVKKGNPDPQHPVAGESLTTADLRRNYKVYAKRIAHYWWEYGEAKKMQLAALLNLLTLTRLNGNETMKNIASDLRWSRINTASPLSERFPIGVGVEEYMTTHTKWADGKTTFGADIISVGLWNSSVLGNFASTDIPLDNFVQSWSNGDWNAVTESNLPEEAQRLIDSISLTMDQFVFGHGANYPWKPVTLPRIQNGKTRALESGSNAVSYRLNCGSPRIKSGKFGTTSDLTTRLWGAYDMWTDYLVFGFSEMMDPNNDRYTFAVEQLKLFKPSSKVEDLLKIIRSNSNYSMMDLANLMTYKCENSANSATVVKFAPALTDTYSHKMFEDDDLITLNCERFNVDNTNITSIIRQAKKWPHLNPTMFTDIIVAGTRPIVLNSAMTLGQETVKTSDRPANNQVIAPVGKFSTMLDYAVSCSAAPEISRISGFGLDAKAQADYVAKGNSIVYEELPDSVWLMSQPLIDSSDPAQCGFNILIADDDPNPNEWVRFFTDLDNYRMVAGSETSVTASSKCPISPADGDVENSAFMRAHVANSAYRAEMKHLFVFVGVGIFNHPWFARQAKTAGFLAYHLQGDGDTDIAVMSSLMNKDATGSDTDSTRKDVAVINWLAAQLPASSHNAESDHDNPNPSTLGLAIAQSQIGDKIIDVYDFMFGPDYGPVEIAAMSVPDSGNNVIPDIGNTDMYFGTRRSFSPKNCFLAVSKLSGDAVQVGPVTAVLQPVAYNPLLTPLVNFVYFLAKVKFPLVSVDTYGSFTVSSMDDAPELDFSEISKWALSLMSEVSIQFVGIHDTHPFWDAIDLSMDAIRIAASNHFPENNILALPRTVQAKRGFNNPKFAGKNDSMTDETSAITRSRNRSDRGDSSRKRKSRNFGKKKFGYAEKHSDNNLTINSDSTAGSTDTAVGVLGKENGMFDSSSKLEDKTFDKKKDAKLSQSNVLGTI